VDSHFAQAKYVDNPEAIANYAQWALRLDGPMIWQTPTPMECTVNSSSPDYIVCPSFYNPIASSDGLI
jgi:pseudouridine-5'-phosphate glycosidase